MKRLAAVLTASSLAMPAFAGGLTVAAPEPVVMPEPAPVIAPSADWSGFYAGAQIGYGDVGSSAALSGNGALGGIHAGYRWDFGRYVAGAEVNYDTASIDLGGADTLDNVARLKLIAGTEMGRSLLYATAGAARADATVGGVGLSDTGYFLGAGLDYAVTDRWTLGGEVLGHRFNDFDATGIDLDATTVSAKVSFRF